MDKITEKTLAQALADALENPEEMPEFTLELGVSHARMWDRETMLTDNAGFTLVLDDGQEFQVTVVQSRGARR